MAKRTTLPAQKGETVTQMEVALRSFGVGFKCEDERGRPPAPVAHRRDGERRAARRFIAALPAPLRRGLINSSFGGGFDQLPGVAVLCVSGRRAAAAGERRDLEEAQRLAREVSTLTFEQIRRAASARRCARSTSLKISPSPWRTATSARLDALRFQRRARASKKRMSALPENRRPRHLHHRTQEEG